MHWEHAVQESATGEWQRPPVVEVAVAIQFDRVAGLTNGHLGRFWGEMSGEYPLSDDLAAAPDIPGGDSDGGPWSSFPAFVIQRNAAETRLRMRSADETRMIQIQNGWLVANWMRRSQSAYPGFRGVMRQFDQALEAFMVFLGDLNLPTPRVKGWEVTYVDHIPIGTVWDHIDDVPSVLPGLFGPATAPIGALEGIQSAYAWRMPDNFGHLNMAVSQGRTTSPPQTDLIIVQTVAKGRVPKENASSKVVSSFLNRGHEAAVECFLHVTSDEAKRYWKGS